MSVHFMKVDVIFPVERITNFVISGIMVWILARHRVCRLWLQRMVLYIQPVAIQLHGVGLLLLWSMKSLALVGPIIHIINIYHLRIQA